MMSWTVHNQAGQRKYLTKKESSSFLRSAEGRDISVRSFCWVLAETGCRISEALALSEQNIDFAAGQITIECLKKRGKKIFRTIPLSPALLSFLRKALDTDALPVDRLWPWSRMTGYRRVREVMEAAGIVGDHASSKGLRHAFGVSAIQSNVPLNLVQRWLGHADMKTTAIYTSAMGPEEREFASRMWDCNTSQTPKPIGARQSVRAPAILDAGTPPKNAAAVIQPGGSETHDTGCHIFLLKLAILLNHQVATGVKALSFAA